MNKVILMLLTIALLVGFPIFSALADLKPARHSGFYVGIGIGGGGLKLKTDLSDDIFEINTDSETGIAGNFRIGFAINNKLLLGFEGNAWSREYDERIDIYLLHWELLVGNAALTATYYPFDYVFVKGGPSIGSTSIHIDSPALELHYEDTAPGYGFMIGVGGELRVKKHFALVPSVQWMWQQVHTDEFEHLDTEADDAIASYFTFTLGAGWFW